MSHDNSTKSVGTLGMALRFCLGLVVLPYVLLRNSFARDQFREMITSSFEDGQKKHLSDPELRDRISFETLTESPTTLCTTDVEGMVRELVTDGDWDSLGGLLDEWDHKRAACPAGRRFTLIALDEIADCYAQGYYEPNDCMPIATPAIERDDVNELERIAFANRSYPSLMAVAAHFRILHAWHHRGGVFADEVSEHQWDTAHREALKAQELLDLVKVGGAMSPLQGAIGFGLVPFLAQSAADVQSRFDVWHQSDPDDLYAFSQLGYYLLPRWFGDFEVMDQYIRKAALESKGKSRSAGYANAYLFVREIEPIVGYILDPDLMAESVRNLASFRKNDPMIIPQYIQSLYELARLPIARKIDDAERENILSLRQKMTETSEMLVKHHLTAICPNAWYNGTDSALDYISEAIQPEIEAGAFFTLGSTGLKIDLPPEPAN